MYSLSPELRSRLLEERREAKPAFKIPLFLTTIVLALATATGALGDDSNDVANQLGTVLGSEEACGLAYDQKAIEDFVNDHVKPSDMSFPSMLDTMTRGTKYLIQSMSESALTAHCTQIRRIAKHYGFTR